MTTTTFPTPAATSASLAESTCGCGQALELCHAAHCPRCGTTLAS